MNARLRRMAYREREQAEADALSAPDSDESTEGAPGSEPEEAGPDADNRENSGR